MVHTNTRDQAIQTGYRPLRHDRGLRTAFTMPKPLRFPTPGDDKEFVIVAALPLKLMVPPDTEMVPKLIKTFWPPGAMRLRTELVPTVPSVALELLVVLRFWLSGYRRWQGWWQPPAFCRHWS